MIIVTVAKARRTAGVFVPGSNEASYFDVLETYGISNVFTSTCRVSHDRLVSLEVDSKTVATCRCVHHSLLPVYIRACRPCTSQLVAAYIATFRCVHHSLSLSTSQLAAVYVNSSLCTSQRTCRCVHHNLSLCTSQLVVAHIFKLSLCTSQVVAIYSTA